MSIDLQEQLACALCGRALHVHIAQLNHLVEARIAASLRKLHPGWSPEASTCPECVFDVVQALRRQRSDTSLHSELHLSYPVYACDETHLIPTPPRVRANPFFRGRGVTVAFLDSGFYAHPDLVEPHNRVRAHVDATLSEPVERPHFRRAEPTSWHGLMVSCVAAGNGRQSGYLYRGVADEASLVLVKTGNRRNRRIPDRDIVRALQWVLEHHERLDVRVINISLGGDEPSTGEPTPLDQLVEEAVARGIVVVAAAGNGGVNKIIPPASARSALTVGGLDDQNSLDPHFRRMWRSSYGRGVGGVLKPDVVAPAIWVAAPMLPRTWVHNEAMLLWQLEQASNVELARYLKTDQARARFKKETLSRPLDQVRRDIRLRIVAQKYIHPHYQHVDGTSMAAPIVSAVAAQMLEANPRLTAAQVKDLIIAHAQPLRYVPREEQGFGAMDGARAVAGALRTAGGPLAGLPISPRITPEAVTFFCHAAGAHEVALVASFNGWQPAGGQMWQVRPGVWQIMVPPPPPGTHAYKFLVDRTGWIHDVENPHRVEDGYGGFHSLLTL